MQKKLISCSEKGIRVDKYLKLLPLNVREVKVWRAWLLCQKCNVKRTIREKVLAHKHANELSYLVKTFGQMLYNKRVNRRLGLPFL